MSWADEFTDEKKSLHSIKTQVKIDIFHRCSNTDFFLLQIYKKNIWICMDLIELNDNTLEMKQKIAVQHKLTFFIYLWKQN